MTVFRVSAPLCVMLTLPVLGLMTGPAASQDLSFANLDGDALTGRSLQLIALLTVLSLAPGIAIMVTCFPFLVTVLAILRQAIGLQQSPPNMLIVSLALFLTYFIMDPVFRAAWNEGLQPLLQDTCQRRSKIGPRGGAKLGHFGFARDACDGRRPVSRARHLACG